MNMELKELTEILGREQGVFQQYLELLTEQQDYLMNNNVDGVKGTIEKINKLAQDAANLENGRCRVMKRLLSSDGSKGSQINLSRLLEKFEGPQFEALERLKDILLKTHEKVIEQKNRNELLIEQSMKVISNTMQFIHDLNNPKATYDNPSTLKRESAYQGALISRTI